MRAILPALMVAFGSILGARCSGSEQSAPLAPESAAFALSGVVTETPPTETTGVSGALIVVDDGPNAGMSARADESGRYSLPGLRASTFNVRARAPGYEDRAGTLVFSADRVMNFRLLPEQRMVTESVSSAIEPCNGEVYIVCFAHSFNMHHHGPITATMTTGAGNHLMDVQVYSVERNYIWASFSRRSGSTEAFTFCTFCNEGKYQFRIVGRILARVPITLSITHPN